MKTGQNDYFSQFERFIKLIIRKLLITPGYFLPEEADDIYQDIFEFLMIKQDTIIGGFKGDAQFSTYLYRIVQRKCGEFRRKRITERSRMAGAGHYSQEEMSRWFGNIRSDELPADTKMVLNECCMRLSDILETYHKKKHKLRFCLTALYRLLVVVNDLQYYKPDSAMLQVLNDCRDQLNNTVSDSTDQEVFSLLTIIFNLLETKKNGNDAIRKWIDDRQDEIVSLLNRPPARSGFSRETLQILFEYCHHRQS